MRSNIGTNRAYVAMICDENVFWAVGMLGGLGWLYVHVHVIEVPEFSMLLGRVPIVWMPLPIDSRPSLNTKKATTGPMTAVWGSRHQTPGRVTEARAAII